MGDRTWETGDGWETGVKRQQAGDKRQETGDERQETGEGRQETKDRRRETGDGRLESRVECGYFFSSVRTGQLTKGQV